MDEINTHHVKINYGKHAGELFTRLPLSYLRWMVNNGAPMNEYAKAELIRRGCEKLPDVEVTRHAIDRASIRAIRIWHRTMMEDEGLATWLARMTSEALKNRDKVGPDKYRWQGMCLVIEKGEHYPILKTITVNSKYRGKRKSRHLGDQTHDTGAVREQRNRYDAMRDSP